MATNPRSVRLRTVRDLGALIRDARTTRDWTQTDLAERAKVSRQWLVSIERGQHSRAEIGMLLRVLKTLGVELLARPVQPTEPSPERPDVDLESLLNSFTGGDEADDG